MKHNYDVFISYRRDTSFETANLIATRLRVLEYRVFFDIDSMRSGKFPEQLYDVIDKCKDVILVLPQNALERCADKNDWVRLEVLRAVNRKKNIIPVMLNGFIWSNPMPQGMEELCYFQSVNAASIEYFDFSMSKLQSFLQSKNRSKQKRNLQYVAIIISIICLLGLYIRPVNLDNLEYPELTEDYSNYSDSLILSSIDSCQLNKYSVDYIKKVFNAAKEGIPKAQCDLANIYYEAGNYNEALYWYSQSAEKNGLAANGLGRCYYHAYGVGRSTQKALAWFIKSAEMHCSEGMNNAGKCYFEGFGLNRPNKNKALEYYKDAAINGYAPAQFNLGIMYLYELGDKKNVEEGIIWLKNAASNGSQHALLALGNIYSEGYKDEIKKDLAKAIEWYKKAKECDSQEVKKQAEIKLNKIENFASF